MKPFKIHLQKTLENPKIFATMKPFKIPAINNPKKPFFKLQTKKNNQLDKKKR